MTFLKITSSLKSQKMKLLKMTLFMTLYIKINKYFIFYNIYI